MKRFSAALALFGSGTLAGFLLFRQFGAVEVHAYRFALQAFRDCGLGSLLCFVSVALLASLPILHLYRACAAKRKNTPPDNKIP